MVLRNYNYYNFLKSDNNIGILQIMGESGKLALFFSDVQLNI